MIKNSLQLNWKYKNFPFKEIKPSIFEIKEKINSFEEEGDPKWINKLYWGDCRDILLSISEELKGKIKMIYIDPPYALGTTGFTKRIKTTQFDNNGVKGTVYEEFYHRKLWEEYLHSYLRELGHNIYLMKELLREDGVLFIHMDPQIVHYVKLLLDSEENFGCDNYQGEIIWNTISLNVAGFKGQAKNWIRGADVILIYSKSDKFEFNKIETNRNVWNDILSFNYVAAIREESRYFSNQKPEQLMKRIIELSTEEGDVIADFYCGSGTTLIVGEKLGRNWLGGDISKDAIEKTRRGLLCIKKKKAYKMKDYSEECQQFEILDCAKFEDKVIDEEAFASVIKFIIQTYNAEETKDIKFFQAIKNDELIYIGTPIHPLTYSEIQECINEFKNNKDKLKGIKKLIFLGWEFEMGLDINIKNLTDPAISSYRIEIKRISAEVLEHLEKNTPTEDDIVDLNTFQCDVNVNGKQVEVTITDFEFKHKEYFKEKDITDMTNFLDWINYWGVAFYFNNEYYVNDWNAYRIKDGDGTLSLTCNYEYKVEDEGEFKILIKVVDVLGNDTNEIYLLNFD